MCANGSSKSDSISNFSPHFHQARLINHCDLCPQRQKMTTTMCYSDGNMTNNLPRPRLGCHGYLLYRANDFTSFPGGLKGSLSHLHMCLAPDINGDWCYELYGRHNACAVSRMDWDGFAGMVCAGDSAWTKVSSSEPIDSVFLPSSWEWWSSMSYE